MHILMFGWREGEIGTQLSDLLIEKMKQGVEVRVIVDGQGSQVFGPAGPMFTRLADAGAQIVVNDLLPWDKDGLYPDHRTFDWSQDEVGRADHRKLYVIDGTVAWTGGAGIEDHFANGKFHDVMVRVTGNVVRQAQALFLMSFRGHGGPLPSDLSKYFPAQPHPGTIPIALLQTVPGGFVSATQATRELFDTAKRRLDVMNPYFTDADMIQRLVAAAKRGVKVRIVVSQTSNNAQATAALKHHYGDLIHAGAQIYEYPGAVVHAKLVVADDTVVFGTVNLDAWALYRNYEIAMMARSAADRSAHGTARIRAGHRQVPPRYAADRPPHPVQGLGVGQALLLPLGDFPRSWAFRPRPRRGSAAGGEPPRARSKRGPPTPRCSTTTPSPTSHRRPHRRRGGSRSPCRASRTPLPAPSRSPTSRDETAIAHRRERSARR